MKIFQNLATLLIISSLLTGHPTFCADDRNAEKIEANVHAEQESILERCFGPGSFLQGLYKHYSDFNLTEIEAMNKDLPLAIAGGVSIAVMLNVLKARENPEEQETISLQKGVCYAALAGFSGVIYLGILWQALKNIDVTRDMEKTQAGKPVKNEHVKKYIKSIYSDWNFGRKFRQTLPTRFCEKHRNMGNLSQLQSCAKELLIEEGLCEINEFDHVKCIGDPFETFGPTSRRNNERRFSDNSIFGRLVYILRGEYTQSTYNEASEVEGKLNDLLHYKNNDNIKPSKHNESKPF